eukprot:311782_1
MNNKTSNYVCIHWIIQIIIIYIIISSINSALIFYRNIAIITYYLRLHGFDKASTVSSNCTKSICFKINSTNICLFLFNTCIFFSLCLITTVQFSTEKKKKKKK